MLDGEQCTKDQGFSLDVRELLSVRENTQSVYLVVKVLIEHVDRQNSGRLLLLLVVVVAAAAAVVSFIKSPASGSSDLIYNKWKSSKTTYKNYNNIMMKKLIEKNN